MRTNLTLSLLVGVLMISSCALCAGAHNPWETKVSITVRDARFDDVLEQLFKGTDLRYTVDPGASDLVVPALNMSNASLRIATDAAAKAAGAVYKAAGNTATFSRRPPRPGETTVAPVVAKREKLVNLEAVNMGLREVLEIIFKDSGYSYTLTHSLSQWGVVTATLVNVPFEQALKQVLNAVGGIVYQREGSVYTMDRTLPGVRTSQRMVSETIPLRFMTWRDAVKIAGNQVMPTSFAPGSVVVKGLPDAVDEAKKAIKLADTIDRLPRAVRIKLIAKVTVREAGKRPSTYTATTESVATEGTTNPLQIDVQQGSRSVSGSRSWPMGLRLSVNLEPSIIAPQSGAGPSKTSIGLVGQGTVEGTLPLWFRKAFDVATSVTPGEPSVIASGSAELGSDTVAFEVVALAYVGGRVKEESFSRSHTAYIHVLGEVKSPGMFEVRSGGIRVDEALVMAGGLTADADTANAMALLRTRGRQKLDMEKVLAKDTKADLYLSSGDAVWIPRKAAAPTPAPAPVPAVEPKPSTP